MGREDAGGRSRRRHIGDMPDLGTQAFVERVALDNARYCAGVGDRLRAATRNRVNGAHAVFAVHRYDLSGRASIRDQRAGKMRTDPSGTILGYQFSLNRLAGATADQK
jgi:hypothetical protein